MQRDGENERVKWKCVFGVIIDADFRWPYLLDFGQRIESICNICMNSFRLEWEREIQRNNAWHFKFQIQDSGIESNISFFVDELHPIISLPLFLSPSSTFMRPSENSNYENYLKLFSVWKSFFASIYIYFSILNHSINQSHGRNDLWSFNRRQMTLPKTKMKFTIH